MTIRINIAIHMDITQLFHRCLQTIKACNTQVDTIVNNKPQNLGTIKCVNNERKNGTKICEINKKVRNLVKSITDMYYYLLNNRKDYINIYSPLLSLASMMTDDQRDQIDEEVEKFIKICNEVIKMLRIEVNSFKNTQTGQHLRILIDLIMDYLKMVCNIHSEQKAVRIKRAIEKQRLLRLGHNVLIKQKTAQINTVTVNDSSRENVSDIENSSKYSNLNNGIDSYNTQIVTEIRPKKAIQNDDNNSYQQIKLSKEELQMFEEENKHLYNQMNSLSDEVKQIEGKVIEIARLQKIFTEKVIQQEFDINKLNETSINSTENIRDGNQQLREAMKKNAGFRVWILFFILTLAFTILFLDWYND